MAEFERLSRRTSWTDLDFIERERTPREIVEVGIRLHIAGLYLSNTKQVLDKLGVKRSRKRFTTGYRKPVYSPAATPNRITSRWTKL